MSREDRSILGWGAFVVAIAALGIALFGLGNDASSSASSEGAGSAAPTVIDVELSEWAVTPSMIEVPEGGATLRVTNNGAMVHNLSIPSLGVKTPDLQSGETTEIEVAGATGQYDALCEIAGHAASGMTAMVVIGDGMGGGGGAMADGKMDWQTMDRIMMDAALAFPAKTQGKGGELLEPTSIDNGVKVYDVTAMEVKWEVEPGKFVDAMTYNGVVPAPEIRLEVGDKIRINFKNDMSESTAIHFHGIRVPNQMDGVDPYNQEVVTPGSSFVYEFEALEPAIGIYHSHHHAEVQVPNGLFGSFIITDPAWETTMPIPQYLQDKGYTQVDKEVTMVLNDAGTIGLSLNGKSFPATEAYTLRKGQTMMVHYLNEGLTAHPMHLHQPVGWVIAKDGIPLDFPMPGDTINVSPGERYTVLYKAVDAGVWAWHCHILTHAEGADGMFGMVTALIVEE
ncbi:MAG: multicopper oxidase domain-containing protein [Ilumatobacteraceae bacterium]